MEEARKEHKGALRIDRGLTQKNPKTYMLQLAKTLSNLRKGYIILMSSTAGKSVSASIAWLKSTTLI